MIFYSIPRLCLIVSMFYPDDYRVSCEIWKGKIYKGYKYRNVLNNMFVHFQDCNGDGITNCYDFSMINFNGAFHCKLPLRRNSDGAAWQYRFERCFNK